MFSFFGEITMERRSERLANLQRLNPISYRETGVKRVFKRIRRKRASLAAQAKREHQTWTESYLQGGCGTSSYEPEDQMQPCCSKDLPDQRHLIIQRCFESPKLMDPNPNIMICPDQQPLVVVTEIQQLKSHSRPCLLETQTYSSNNTATYAFQSTERSRPIMKTLIFLTLVFILGIFSGFLYALGTPSDAYKQVMKLQLSRQNEALQQHLQKHIYTFRQQVTGLQSLLDAFVSVHGYWENQKHRFVQVGSSAVESSRIQKEDFALKSAGASVVKCSKSFKTEAQVCMLGFCWDYSRSPEVILERDNTPGNCWAMEGSQGYVVIKLSQEICPVAVTLDHITKIVSHTEEISSAPKNFSVHGFKDDFEKEEGTFLGSFVYRIDGFPMQTFKLEPANSDRFKYLLLKILSNWDHPNYTCIYGFHVYGE
ncbi:SUN domain-containing protein 2-like isoform X2 [Hemicordylus capensis]|uniref:SUN domain-containing protein 2-like isoform X2 n=1 Tax=Hemicordylus capensis TaxID=884348 RepID=UPI0023023038|nr:SUN domain-containing protein 2-like isoform X2 [Hemicordylus capensis]